MLLLGQLALPGAAGFIAPLLEDVDSDVRIAAAGALSELAEPAAARALVTALEHGVIAPERVIERLGAAWAVPTLLASLQNTRESARARAWMARALGLSNDRRAEPMLRGMLVRGSDEERISAARAIGTCGSAASVAALTGALVDACAPVRAQAATAVGTLGLDTTAPMLERSLSDASWWVRANAATSLVSFGDAGIAVLVGALGNRDRYARDRAAEALALAGHRPRGAVVTTGVAA